MDGYVFSPVDARGVDAVMELIRERILWFEARGIRQWRMAEYFEEYPRGYFEKCAAEGRLFGMMYGGRLCGCVVLSESDPVWEDDLPAVYIHNLATDPRHPGLGRTMVEMGERHALQTGKRAVRLDCQGDNVRLNRFYRELGYELVGTVISGAYKGDKWEKRLK